MEYLYTTHYFLLNLLSRTIVMTSLNERFREMTSTYISLHLRVQNAVPAFVLDLYLWFYWTFCIVILDLV